MALVYRPMAVCVSCILILLSGCGQSDDANPLTADSDALLNELLGSPEETGGEDGGDAPLADNDYRAANVAAGNELQSTDNDTSESIVRDILGESSESRDSLKTALVGDSSYLNSAVPIGQQSASGNRSIRFETGQQFPFVKTVQQTVAQTTTDPTTGTQIQVSAQTLMHLTFHLNVLNASPAGSVIGVQYLRVQYSQDVNGQRTTFDSSVSSPGSVPPGLETYAAMVGHGFQFSVAADNTISSIAGLSAFLDQCVIHAPFDQRAILRGELQKRFQSNPVAELVDESISVLPFGSTMPREGDIWMTNRVLQHQAQMSMETTCQMLSVSGATAEVGLSGRFQIPVQSGPVSVSDGRMMGKCQVDLVTGLPVHAQRSCYLKIESQQATGKHIEVTKKIESSLTSRMESHRLIVQQATSSAPPNSGEGRALPRTAAASEPAAYGSPSSGSVASDANSNGLIIPGAASSSSVSAVPVSSSNLLNSTNSTSTIPDVLGGVPADELSSTAEADYPFPD